MAQRPVQRQTLWFERGVTGSDIHIDHLVALSDAWQKRVQLITYDQRKNFANDPLNLWAVDGGLNMQKGDADAATWLPPNDCALRLCRLPGGAQGQVRPVGHPGREDALTTVVNGSRPAKKIPVANNVPALSN